MTGAPSPSLLRDAVDAAIVSSPYLGFLGVRSEVHDGVVTVVLPASSDHIGDAERRSVHGGVQAAFAEAAARVHLQALGAATRIEPVDVTIDFLREAAIVDTCAAIEVVRIGRRFATVRIDLWQADRRRPVAVAQASYRLHHEKAPPAR